MALTDKLSAIGAAIRTKTGKTDPLTLDEMVTEIESIQTSEDVTAETNEYTAKITQLESAVTALEAELQGKTSGGGGGSVATCTVNITMSSGIASESYGALVYENGIYSVKCHKGRNGAWQPVYPITITNVVCNSMLFIHLLAGYASANVSGNCELVDTDGSPYMYFLLSANAGETITIDLYNADE